MDGLVPLPTPHTHCSLVALSANEHALSHWCKPVPTKSIRTVCNWYIYATKLVHITTSLTVLNSSTDRQRHQISSLAANLDFHNLELTGNYIPRAGRIGFVRPKHG